jgi:hypothetical protein
VILQRWQVEGVQRLIKNNVVIVDSKSGREESIIEVAKTMHIADILNSRERERKKERNVILFNVLT